MKRVLFFSCEPGGAEVLIPIIQLLQTTASFTPIVLGYGYASERFEKKGITHHRTRAIRKNDTTLFDTFNPDCIITSACSLPHRDMSEKYLWYNAKQYQVPTIAFLDSWQNYSIRFSGNDNLEKLKYTPDFINCINEVGRQEMLLEGFDDAILMKFGQPYLSSVKKLAKNMDVHVLKEVYKLPRELSVYLFISEAIFENYGDTRGYTQYQVLRYFLQNVYRKDPMATVVVKLHPKDRIELFESIKISFQDKDIRFFGEDIQPAECIIMSDYIFGMSSIMLIEAYILGKRVISLQPNLMGGDPCILSKYNYIPLLDTCDDFEVENLFFNKENYFEYEFKDESFLSFLKTVITNRRASPS